jgi:hypothetical protein
MLFAAKNPAFPADFATFDVKNRSWAAFSGKQHCAAANTERT